jgi:hypothetical protein
MEFKRDVLLGMGALVLVLVAVCFGTIGLLARMSPAIEHVLEENDESVEGVEQMLAVLAEAGPEPIAPQAKLQFQEALARVRANVTEAEEEPEIGSVSASWEAAAAGDAKARKDTVEALRRLAAVNRAAMHRANHEAQQLGSAGAWAAALLCALGFGAALVVKRRLDRRILRPIDELTTVLAAVLAGDSHRRCTIAGAPQALTPVMRSINTVLDRSGTEQAEDPDHDVMLVAFRHLLDEGPPRVLVDDRNRVLAASRSVVAAIDEEAWAGTRQVLALAMKGDVRSPVRSCEAVGPRCFLCTLDQTPNREHQAVDVG